MRRPAASTLARWLSAVALSAAVGAGAARAAVITIVNLDGPGEGFNDPTPAAPVGGNPGATIGAQRLFVFQHAADLWGSLLTSDVEIRVNAQFNPQFCTATSGVLGSAGPVQVFRDFPNAPFAGTWYHVALANRLAAVDLSGSNDISTTFNSSIGGPNCLPQGWYYGVDGNEGSQIELLPVVLHELGHGLGFSTTTSGLTGAQLSGFPSIYDRFLLDTSLGLHWHEMSDAERAGSGVNCRRVLWDGPNVAAFAPLRLDARPLLQVNSPGAIAGTYDVGAASFGPPLDEPGVTAAVVLVDDATGTPSDGCEPPVNGAQLSGNIALVDRGNCAFTVKVKNAQDAGAIGVIVADNAAGCPPSGMSGSDPTITIPSVRVTQSDGATLKANLGAGVNGTLKVDPSLRAGADENGRVMIYTPNPYQSGSSVSHWDTSTEPSLLMEPALTPALSSDVDLTFPHLADIGWVQGVLAAQEPRAKERHLAPSFPNPSFAGATIRFSLEGDESVELDIYDLAGRRVSRLVAERMPRGTHRVRWDGRDQAGQPAPAGVYVFRLKCASFSEARHLVIVR